jgi:hypothetical protein
MDCIFTCVQSTCSGIVLQTTNQVQGSLKLTLLLEPTTRKRNCPSKLEDMRDRRHNKHVSIHWLRPTVRAVLFCHDTGQMMRSQKRQYGKPDISPVPSCRHTHASPAKSRSEIVVVAAQRLSYFPKHTYVYLLHTNPTVPKPMNTSDLKQNKDVSLHWRKSTVRPVLSSHGLYSNRQIRPKDVTKKRC